jgi:hypothetical protein
MAAAPDDLDIANHIAGFLLRYFRRAERVGVNRPYVDAARDRDLLRLHWALSPVVQNLATYVLQHCHEIQSVLTPARRIEDSILRGRIDARATLLHRRMTGLATAMVSHEPLRSYDSGPNQVLIWVLMQAWSLASRFAAMLPDSATYRAAVNAAVQSLEQVRRIHAISLMSADSSVTRRPGSAAVLEAGRSRREIYRRAREVYETLGRIESGDPEAITAMLRATLLGPLEAWRRYELAVFWQTRTSFSRAPALEPSERVTQHILDVYNLSAASDRPDLVVIDDVAGVVASVIEVKYLTAEDAADRVRSAVAQLVRYARLYHPIDETGPLLGRSLVAVNQGIDAITAPSSIPDDAPLIADFAAIRRGQLAAWAHRLRT